MYEDVCNRLEKIQKDTGDRDILDFMEKVIERFTFDQNLKKIYSNKDLLEKQLE